LNAAIMLKESYRRNYLFASEMRMVRFSLRRKIGREVTLPQFAQWQMRRIFAKATIALEMKQQFRQGKKTPPDSLGGGSQKHGVTLSGENLGGNHGKTVNFHLEDGIPV
ncbi:MAG: hypothetical protein V1909_01105, partial [Candidatus Micrarchaeota archaeon]